MIIIKRFPGGELWTFKYSKKARDVIDKFNEPYKLDWTGMKEEEDTHDKNQ